MWIILLASKVHVLSTTTNFKCCSMKIWVVGRSGVGQVRSGSSIHSKFNPNGFLCIYSYRLKFHMRFYLNKALQLTKSSLKPCIMYEVLPGRWMGQALELGQGRDKGNLCSKAVRDNNQQAGKACTSLILCSKSGSTPASLWDLGQGIPKLYLPQVQHGITLVLLFRTDERITCSKI